jgi:hypothetical protein
MPFDLSIERATPVDESGPFCNRSPEWEPAYSSPKRAAAVLVQSDSPREVRTHNRSDWRSSRGVYVAVSEFRLKAGQVFCGFGLSKEMSL